MTSPARTLADLSGVVGAQLLGRLVDDGLRRHLLVLDDLREVYDVLACRGRRRLTVLRAVLEDRLPGFHPGDSPAELDVRRILVDAGLGEPVPQYQVVVGSTVYLLDWAYPDDRIAIEFNGWDFHRTRSAFDHDAARYARADRRRLAHAHRHLGHPAADACRERPSAPRTCGRRV